MTELAQAVDIWHGLAQQLNQIHQSQGEITKDDPRIWRGYLHQWTNEEWQLLLTAMCELHQHHPDMFKRFHTDNLTAAVSTLIRQSSQHSRVLDRKQNKGLAWKMIMSAREVWNTACDLNVPVSAAGKPLVQTPSNRYTALFLH